MRAAPPCTTAGLVSFLGEPAHANGAGGLAPAPAAPTPPVLDPFVIPLEPVVVETIVEDYEGGDVDGRYEGSGVAYFRGGHVYAGEFHDGFMHGKGVFTWASGVRYEGDFYFNKITGLGSYMWPDGSTYEGEVLNGVRNGYGVLKVASCPSRYEGNFVQGRREGQGTLYYDPEGKAYYRGEWQGDRKHGFGVMVYPSGNTYEGQWANDLKNGHGTMVWKASRERYTGEWKDGVQTGRGEHLYAIPEGPETLALQLPNRYEGQFANGVREGRGTFLYASGARYEGDWRGNQKAGTGLYRSENGTVYVGPFEADRMADPEGQRRAEEAQKAPVLQFDADDLYDEDEGGGARLSEAERAAAVKQVQQTITRYNSELRKLYRSLCAVAEREAGALPDPQLGAGEASRANALLLRQLWHLCRATGVAGPQLTLAQLDRIVRRVQGRSPSAAAASPGLDPFDPHDPGRPLLYREFLEALVRAALPRYPLLPPPARVALLLSSNVLAYRPPDPAAPAVLRERNEELQEAYADFCAERGVSDRTLALKDFLRMLRRVGVVEDEHPPPPPPPPEPAPTPIEFLPPEPPAPPPKAGEKGAKDDKKHHGADAKGKDGKHHPDPKHPEPKAGAKEKEDPKKDPKKDDKAAAAAAGAKGAAKGGKEAKEPPPDPTPHEPLELPPPPPPPEPPRPRFTAKLAIAVVVEAARAAAGASLPVDEDDALFLEMLFPEFLENLVRLANVRFFDAPPEYPLEERVAKVLRMMFEGETAEIRVPPPPGAEGELVDEHGNPLAPTPGVEGHDSLLPPGLSAGASLKLPGLAGAGAGGGHSVSGSASHSARKGGPSPRK
eukprot:tig00021571_g22372.t1